MSAEYLPSSWSFNRVDDRLWLGAVPPSLAVVREAGLTRVLCVCAAEEVGYPLEGLPDLPVHHVPLVDATPNPTQAYTLAALHLAREDRDGQQTVVHCSAGVSRSATVAALFLMGKYGWTWERSVTWIRESRPMVQPDPNLIDEWAKARVARAVSEYFSGGDGTCASAAEDYARYLAFVQAPVDDVPADQHWFLVEPRLAVAHPPASLDRILGRGFDRLLYVDDPDDPLPTNALCECVNVRDLREETVLKGISFVDEKIANGNPVCVVVRSDPFYALFFLMAYFGNKRRWDMGTSIFYLRSRKMEVQRHLTRLYSSRYTAAIGAVAST